WKLGASPRDSALSTMSRGTRWRWVWSWLLLERIEREWFMHDDLDATRLDLVTHLSAEGSQPTITGALSGHAAGGGASAVAEPAWSAERVANAARAPRRLGAGPRPQRRPTPGVP